MRLANENDIKSLFGKESTTSNTYKIYVVGNYTEDSLDEYLLLKEIPKPDLSSVTLDNFQQYMQEHINEVLFDVFDFNAFGHSSSHVGIDVVGATQFNVNNEKLQIVLPYADIYICLSAQWE